jgi:hypothetical protein
MAIFLTLYCARPVSHVSSKDVLTGMDFGRLHAVAAEWGVAGEEVASALANLRVRTGAGSLKAFSIHFRPEEWGAVQVLIIADPDEVERWRQTALDSLDGASLGPIRERLGRTVEVVSVRLGWDLIDAGVALGWLAGEFLARLGEALLFDPNDNWLAIEGGSTVTLHAAPHG